MWNLPGRGGSSPLSRGIPPPVPGAQPPAGIIPALAGNTGVGGGVIRRPSDHPRSRGEYCRFDTNSLALLGSSPLSRGILRLRPHSRRNLRIIPALAGNTSGKGSEQLPVRDHPRSRGEYSSEEVHRYDTPGSSPLSRGIRILPGGTLHALRIIPALAGNTAPCGMVLITVRDHPRSRGEY